MQVYARRDDVGVIADVLSDILSQVSSFVGDQDALTSCVTALKQPGLTETKIRTTLPSIRRILSIFASRGQELFIFLDDFHVLAKTLQPRLLDMLYAISRGNRLFLKLSAIETLMRTFDLGSKQGFRDPDMTRRSFR